MPRMMPPKNDVPVARIAGPFGVRGEVKCDPTDAGRTLVLAGAEFYWEGASIKLTSVRPHKGRLLVRIEGVDDADRRFALQLCLVEQGQRSLPLLMARCRVAHVCNPVPRPSAAVRRRCGRTVRPGSGTRRNGYRP